MKLYTIVLTHYNQMEYIEEALDSVFIQNYPNIELLITDDASKNFDEKKITEYIKKHKKKNIKNFKILVNEKNIGTTKTLNKALKASTGEYIQFFAADDALYDKNVISNFVKAFNKSGEKVVTAQCFMCGTTLDKINEKYCPTKYALKLNKEPVIEQFYELCNTCIYGAGATAYDKKVFEELGYFSEKYKLVEDWSYYLLLTLNGYRIFYSNFNAFLHRTGGVSHYENKDLPPHVKQYQKDILTIYEDLVFPNIGEMNIKKKADLYYKYKSHVEYYSKQNPELKDRINVLKDYIKKNPEVKMYMFINKIKTYMHTQLFHTLIYILIFTTLIDLIITWLFNLKYIYVLIHISSLILAYISIKILKTIKRRLKNGKQNND